VGNLDLIDWTMETAKELRTPNDLATIAPVAGGEPNLRSDDWLLMSDPGIEVIPPQLMTEKPASRASDEPSTHASTAPSVAEPGAAPPEPEAWTPSPDLHVALLQAVVDPDIHTSRADRYRAIDLRWILRDIAADRVKTWPISRRDLQILIDMKLVELRGDVPHLTNSGVNAII
jgi:hypothetical protein